MPRWLLALTAALVSLGSFCFSAAAPAVDCNNATDQRSINHCAKMAFGQADDELNRLYGLISQRLSGDAETKRLLVSSQRAWISFRDGECAFAASAVSGGSIYPAIYSGCLERLTRQRVADFTAYLNCQEGDLNCPVPFN